MKNRNHRERQVFTQRHPIRFATLIR